MFRFILLIILFRLPNHSVFSITTSNVNIYKPVESIMIRCGFSGNILVDNRNFTGDISSIYSPVDRPNDGVSSVKADAPPHTPNLNRSLYGTARLSHSQFTYSFSVTEGQKFIRLHFYPASYLDNFDRSNSLFTVKSGPFTLLKDFNASLTADNDNRFEQDSVGTLSREYCVNVEQGQRLNITFIPNTTSHPEAYAFINWIEVVSMPDDLYYTKPDDQGIKGVGDNNGYIQIENETALEMMYRIDVGGSLFISPKQDTGMFRAWETDERYLNKVHDYSVPSSKILPHYTSQVPNYTAPDQVYLTARSYGKTEKSRVNVTWSFEVDADFNYMVRLHFCEVESYTKLPGNRVFQIFIAEEMAERAADVIKWSGGNLFPYYKDYGVLISSLRITSGNLKRPNLTIKLQQYPDRKATTYDDVLLNGIEIFKLSNWNNILGAPNPEPLPSPPSTQQPLSTNNSNNKKTLMLVSTIVGAIFAGFLLIISALVIFRRRSRRTTSTASGNCKSSKGHGSSSLPSHLCRYFSIAEIIAATGNFDANFIVGVGGFGSVYKGYIDDGITPVAIKRLKSGSQQGEQEFQTEIEMLSQLRHLHLVSLIGFCNDGNEMILVYNFMQRGTLYDHLYDSTNKPLLWKKRLEICLGTARGLHYLHTGAKHNIIHRDVKTTNILLDETWVAKVSDFGLSKVGPTGMSQSHVSTVVKGSLGYLDPEYFSRQRLTLKSDVYSFGVVLLEVLCGRPPVLRTVEKQRVSLVEWVKKCHGEGVIDQTVDKSLKGSISPQCLKAFSELALSCLVDDGNQRPSMSDVVGGLEFALQLVESCREENKLLLLPHVMSDEDESDEASFINSTEESESKSSKVTTTTSTSEDRTSVSAAVFSEITNPTAR